MPFDQINLEEQPSTIYPGCHVPLLSEEDVELELRSHQEYASVSPAVNITELPDSFKLEVAIPGSRRENISILAEDNILKVYALPEGSPSSTQINYQQHEFECGTFNRQILLPEQSDAEFMSAEYKDGILYLVIPKTAKPSKCSHTRIAVY